MTILRIATRKSSLAWWQAQWVQQQLQQAHPELSIELLGFSTQGDKILDTPLAKIGGKGLFTKELEVALLEGEADIAVHSIKDIPVSFPVGLFLAAICERDDPRDAFVSNHYTNFSELPPNACVGTASLRRQSQLLALRPDLCIQPLRGNVNTRLAKLDAGDYDAIILSTAGLERLSFEGRIQQRLAIDLCLPAVGQGTIGVECRSDDSRVQQWLKALHHLPSAICISAERAVNARLQGGCQVPIAAHAQIREDTLFIEALVAQPDGKLIIKDSVQGALDKAEYLGCQLAEQLLAQGADKILAAL